MRRLHSRGFLALVSCLWATFALATGSLAQAVDRAGESDVIFSEIHYHPPGDPGREEFIELYNSGVHWVDLGGWSLTQGVRYTFPAGTVISPRGYLVVARDREAVLAAHGNPNLPVVGDFKGRLSNQGDILELRTRVGRVAAWIHYHDGFDDARDIWPRGADGFGPSLELVYPHPEWSRAWYWAASRRPGGTPGGANSLGWVVPGSKRPGEEAIAASLQEARLQWPDPFVEIENRGASTLSLAGFRLTTDPRGAGGVALAGQVRRGKTFVLEGKKLAPLLPAQDGEDAAKVPPALLLVQDKSRVPTLVDVLLIRPAPPQGSCVRASPRTGDSVVVARAEPGKDAAVPAGDAIVINEVHYNGLADGGEDEFIELHNQSKATVLLGGWRLRRGVTFSFPDEARIPAGGHVVVAANPEKTKARLATALKPLVFGPYKGKLSNSGETLVLDDQFDNTVDVVAFDDDAPWPPGADGEGYSLELLNPALDNRWGQAWIEGAPDGSPCRQNARYRKHAGPFIAQVWHEPALPGPGDSITIHAQVIATRRISRVALAFRDARVGGSIQQKAFSDKGRSGDGSADDGHYAVSLPRLPGGALVAYSVQARDRAGSTLQVPRPPQEYYFEIDTARRVPLSWPTPVYSTLMTPKTWEAFTKSRRRDKEWFPCTFIASIGGPRPDGFRFPGEPAGYQGKVSHEASMRYRGSNSLRPERNPLDTPDDRMSYRVRVQGGMQFDGRRRFILNAYSSYRQKAGWDVFRTAGLLGPSATLIILKTPGREDGAYLDVEVINNDFLDDKLGGSGGDLFRGRRGNPFGADFKYHGPDVEPYLRVYRRENKKDDKDLTALLNLLQVLETTDDGDYARKVPEVADVDEWALYFAANNVVGNVEGGLSFDAPDDFFLGQHPDTGRYLIIPWDNDSTFVEIQQKLFRPQLPAIRRFLRHPAFASRYHRSVREVIEGPLALPWLWRWLAYYDGRFAKGQLANIERFADSRRLFLLDSYYPLRSWTGFDVNPGEAGSTGGGRRLFVTGQPASLAFKGRVDPSAVGGVRFAGNEATFDGVVGDWKLRVDTLRLSAGPNTLWLEMLDHGGNLAALEPINVESVAGKSTVQGNLAGQVRWEASKGPVLVAGPLRIPAGSSLTIGPGVEVVCGPQAEFRVEGKLNAEGSLQRPVAFRATDPQALWRGIHFVRTGAGPSSRAQILRHCRFDGGRAPTQGEGPVAALGAFIRLERSHVLFENCVFEGIHGVAIGAVESLLETKSGVIRNGRNGIRVHGGRVQVDGLRIDSLYGDGIEAARLTQEGSMLRNCQVRRVDGRAIRVEAGRLSVDNCLLLGNSVGLQLLAARVDVDHLTAASHGVVVAVDRSPGWVPLSTAARGQSRLQMANSVLWPNDRTFVLGSGVKPVLQSCIIVADTSREAVPKGTAITLRPPRYRAPERGDFQLAPSSPGVKTASDGRDLGYAAPPSTPTQG